MIVAKWCKQLPDGKMITLSEILSPFTIYRIRKRYNTFLLVPRQEELSDIIIIANEAGVRLCCNGSWPKSLFRKLRELIQTKGENLLEPVHPDSMSDIQDIVCSRLISLFCFRTIDDVWTIRLKTN